MMETLIRVHREGEGASYTGLKPAGSTDPIFAAADAALESGEGDDLAAEVARAVERAIHERYRRAVELRKHVGHGVKAGREYVEAYVTYMHFVEGIHAFVEEGPAGHGSGAAHDH